MPGHACTHDYSQDAWSALWARLDTFNLVVPIEVFSTFLHEIISCLFKPTGRNDEERKYNINLREPDWNI